MSLEISTKMIVIVCPQLVGYARKTQFGWSLSQATKELILEYKTKYVSNNNNY